MVGAIGSNRPLLYRLLPITELCQRYLAHMRTVLEESFNPAVMTPLIDRFHTLAIDAIRLDPNKGSTMAAYTNEVRALKTYVTNRCKFLSTHAELTPPQPNIPEVFGPGYVVTASDTPFVTARVVANGTSGQGSVWLYHRGQPYGRFAVAQMFDDGAHGDGAAGDDVFGAATARYPAGTTTGLHASFKLSAGGEEIYLADSDANDNAVLDRVVFGPLETDQAYGRTAEDADVWSIRVPTPGQPNR